MRHTRNFGLDDILSVSTGRLLSRRHMEGLYDILGFMSNDEYITTIGLYETQPRCNEEILRQHPELEFVALPDFSAMDNDEIYEWVTEQEEIYGKILPVTSLDDSLLREHDLDVITRIRGDKAPVVVVLVDGDNEIEVEVVDSE